MLGFPGLDFEHLESHRFKGMQSRGQIPIPLIRPHPWKGSSNRTARGNILQPLSTQSAESPSSFVLVAKKIPTAKTRTMTGTTKNGDAIFIAQTPCR
jgi:hypothetical protein